MTSISPRVTLTAFALANPFYAGASVTVLVVDRSTWQATTEKATLYAAASGTTEVANPLRLDGDGKFLSPIYVDGPVIMRITGANVPAHDTGVTGQTTTFRGEWAAATDYQIGDLVRDGEAGANSGSLYLAAGAHRSGAWATDLAADFWTLYLDAVDAGALRAINNLDDVADTDTARANLGAASQTDLDAAEVLVDQANADRIVSALVDTNGVLILTKLSGDTINAGYVVGPPGDVSVVGTPLGTWDADTNTPVLSDGSGTPGDAYIVAIAGTTTIDGVSAWAVGDTIYRGAAAWERIPGNPTPAAFTTLTIGDITISSDGDTAGGAVIADAYGEIIMRFADAETLLKGFTVGANGPEFASATMDEATIGDLTATIATIAGALNQQNDQEAGYAIADPYGEILQLINTFGIHWPGVSLSQNDGSSGYRIGDRYGEVAFEVTSSGSIRYGGLEIYITDGPAGLAFGDAYGELYAKFDENSVPSGFGSSGGGGSSSPLEHGDDEIAARDGIVRGEAAAMAVRQVTTVQRPVYEVNHFVVAGQSLAAAAEGSPVLSTTTKYDNLSLGTKVRSVNNTASDTPGVGANNTTPPTFEVTGSGFNALTATGDAEVITHGALNTYRRMYLEARGIAAEPNIRFATNGIGVGGLGITALSKGATPEYYNRYPSLVTQAKAAADTAVLTYAVAGYLWLQGEAGQTETYSFTLAALRQHYADVVADTIAVTSQPNPPAFFIYQTAAPNWNFDSVELGKATAQLDFANDDGVFMVGPYYQYPDSNNLHLVANTYRWLGSQFGKVMHRVLTLGHRWRPLHAMRATLRGDEILVDYHVPHPPLVFDNPWMQDGWFVGETATGQTNTQVVAADKGYSVVRSVGGYAAIETVTIVSPTQVKIKLFDVPATGDLPLYLRFADGVHFGNGNLRDSDPTLADDVWLDGVPGQVDADTNPTLSGARYPLYNWAVAQQITVETLA